MPLKIPFSHIGPDVNIKDFIIETLSKESPLTLKQLHNRIRKAGRSVTYQAVHKAVQELMRVNVLSKEDNKYSLHHNYIELINDFSKKLQKDSQEKKKQILEELESNQSVLLKFEKMIDMGAFLFSLFSDDKDEEICFILSFVWCSLTLSKSEYELVKTTCSENRILMLSYEDSGLNRYFADLWRSFGMDVRLGVKLNNLADTVLYKDLVIQVFMEDNYEGLSRKEMFSRPIDSIELNTFYEVILQKKCNIPVIITRDGELAGQLRRKVEEKLAEDK